MSEAFSTYGEAKRYAESRVRSLQVPFGIEKMAGMRKGEIVFSVKMLPKKMNRFGWELRCEPIEPEDYPPRP